MAVSKQRRQVKLVTEHNTIFVRFVTRKTGQRYNAAQFYIGRSRQSGWNEKLVKHWISNHPDLELIE